MSETGRTAAGGESLGDRNSVPILCNISSDYEFLDVSD